jgi:sialic acid synthase SpsE
MDVVKVSSSDLNNAPFIDVLCELGKPIVLSTGAAWLWEIEQAIARLRAHGNPLAILHCVLSYPAADADANLAVIPTLAQRFPEHVIGYSDHTLPGDMRVCETATLLGARIIEKHFTHDKTLPGNDHYHAMDAADLRRLWQRLDDLAALLGSGTRAPLACEADPRRYARRSLVLARDVAAGSALGADDLTWKRPGVGIDPRDFDAVVGSIARTDLAEDTVLHWDLIERRRDGA